VIELKDVAYVRSGAADLATAVDFATRIVGLELVDSDEPGVAHLRADQRHHCLALVEGASGVIASGFALADDDALALAETELEQRGITVTRGDAAACRSRRVRSFIGLDDPFGNRIELVVGQVSQGRPVQFTRRAGITEGTIRLSIGLEDRADLIDDLAETRGCRQRFRQGDHDEPRRSTRLCDGSVSHRWVQHWLIRATVVETQFTPAKARVAIRRIKATTRSGSTNCGMWPTPSTRSKSRPLILSSIGSP